MNREILFRGRTKEGEWVYGDLFHMCGKVYIDGPNFDEKKEVDPDSVGQFTEFCDERGVKIFEGDLVSVNKASGKDSRWAYILPVRLDCGKWCFGNYFMWDWIVTKKGYDIRVVGNVIDGQTE